MVIRGVRSFRFTAILSGRARGWVHFDVGQRAIRVIRGNP